MPEKLSSRVIQQVYFICEGMVENMINSITDKREKEKWVNIKFFAKKIFKNRIPYVNWYFQQTFGKHKYPQVPLERFQHFYDYGIPKIDNFPVVNYTLEEVLDKFKAFEKEFQEGSKRLIPIDKVDDSVEEILVCSNPNFVWFDLNTDKSDQESKAMGHCGRDSCDTLFSLREKKFMGGKHYGWEPHVTASFHYSGRRLSQVKGRENKKPVKKYHKYIIELLEKGIVEDFGGRSYAQEEDFGWGDISEDTVKKLLADKYPPDGLVYSTIVKDDVNLMVELVNSKLAPDGGIPFYDYDPYADYDDQEVYSEKEYRVFSPVKIASSLGSMKIVKFLIKECNVDVEMDDDDGISVIQNVVLNQEEEIFKILLEKDINLIHENNDNPLVDIVENNWEDGLKILISSGFDINYHQDLLLRMYCTSSKRDYKMIKFLVDNGADVHVRNEKPLKNAIRYYHYSTSEKLSVIKCLLDNGADATEIVTTGKVDGEDIEGEIVDLLNKYRNK